MHRKMPLLFILGVTFLIGVLHYVGTYLLFYWRYTGFDKIVHFSGGFLVAFVVLCVIFLQKMPHVSKKHLWTVGFFATLFMGLAWEIFELKAGNTAFSDKGYWLDNGGDVLADLIGGCAAIYYFIRRYRN